MSGERRARRRRARETALLLPLLLSLACASTPEAAPPEGATPGVEPLPVFEDRAAPADPALRLAKGKVLLRGARILTAAGEIFERGHLLLEEGRIAAVGEGPGALPEGVEVIDLSGRVITPGLIDVHSHLGVYPSPGVEANADGNEMVSPTTPEVWAEHGFWPQDPDLERALQGGVTTVQVLPGSANLVGGRSFVLRLEPGPTSARAMRFPGAPQGLKMACGENPKVTYGNKGGPKTRMGNTARLRALFQRAREYQRKLARYRLELETWRREGEPKGKSPPDPPPRNLGLETLVEVLEGRILVQNHCYRADEMEKQLDLAAEFGFEVRAFHHATGAYKLRHRLAREKVAAATWTDWWGFKMEALDGVPQNLALLEDAGALAVLHSDSASEIRYLNQEAAKAATAGRRIGLRFDEDRVLRWITANPAWVLGLEDRVGTLEVGKLADLVVWSGDPFSVYTRVDQVWVGGRKLHDRAAPSTSPASDFELGQGAR
ncbi:MAG: amidohydrolase family protein [Deltaproteobacteria bacterium]|nr:amidohydrolase family protein [Deltaproteobacteria bacterium]